MRSKRNWKFQQLVDILLLNKSERICTARPVGVTENCAFLIDTSKLAHPDDWKTDDHGTWRNHGNAGFILTIREGVIIGKKSMP